MFSTDYVTVRGWLRLERKSIGNIPKPIPKVKKVCYTDRNHIVPSANNDGVKARQALPMEERAMDIEFRLAM
ncbi:MAG: hypothetical protein WBW16_02870 [Bacteroidota bacterium]